MQHVIGIPNTRVAAKTKSISLAVVRSEKVRSFDRIVRDAASAKEISFLVLTLAGFVTLVALLWTKG